jgi:NAD(P)-dependent dehydrogenase (short-subunit alcohol dehydrogenase family)
MVAPSIGLMSLRSGEQDVLTQRLAGKVAIVTEAAAGIGQAIAETFGREGASVIIANINATLGCETAERLRDQGYAASFCEADVSVESDVERMIGFAIERHGRLDCAVNNAGVETGYKPIHALSLADWETVMRVNLTGVFLCLKYELAYMTKNGGGSIVNISSIAGRRGLSGAHAYSASKRGVLSLTATTAMEAGSSGVRVNAILPGMIATEMLQQASIDNKALSITCWRPCRSAASVAPLRSQIPRRLFVAMPPPI